MFKWLKRLFFPETNKELMIAQLTAVNVGANFAKNHPGKVKNAIRYCDMLLIDNKCWNRRAINNL